jgi:hypothetical protein
LIAPRKDPLFHVVFHSGSIARGRQKVNRPLCQGAHNSLTSRIL